MLATLGTNQAIGANSSQSFSYSPSSVQKIFIKLDDPTVGTTMVKTNVTVQLGSRTVVNGVTMWGLCGYTNLTSGFANSSTDQTVAIDLGSWFLETNENLTVTVSTENALDAVDVSAIVDEPIGVNQIQFTVYEDTVFASERVICAIGYNSGENAIDEDSKFVTMRNSAQSSSPNVISGVSWYRTVSKSASATDAFSLLCMQQPLTTSFNYASSTNGMDRILVAQSIPSTAGARMGMARANRSSNYAQ